MTTTELFIREQIVDLKRALERKERLRFASSQKIEVYGQVFDHPLIVEHEDKEEIVFSSCVFNSSFILRKINCQALPDSKRRIIFDHCRFARNIDFYSVGNTQYYPTCIEFRNVDFTDIKLSESSLDEVIFRQSVGRMIYSASLENLDSFVAYDSRFESADINLSKPDQNSKIQFKESHINNYLSLSNFAINNIKLNNKFLCFLYINNYTKRQLKYSTFSKKLKLDTQNSLNIHDKLLIIDQYENLLLTLYDTFSSRHMYSDADQCYPLIQKLRYERVLLNHHWIDKIIHTVQFLIFGFVFGWGMKLFNIAISMLIIVLCYTLIYTYPLSEGKSISLNILYEAFEISVSRFFNTGNGYQCENPLIYFDIQESVIGIVMITLFGASLIRKIIR